MLYIINNLEIEGSEMKQVFSSGHFLRANTGNILFLLPRRMCSGEAFEVLRLYFSKFFKLEKAAQQISSMSFRDVALPRLHLM